MRTFVWFLVGFVALVLVFVAAFALQGRGVREYGVLVARAATGPGPCGKVAPAVKVPDGVQACTVRRDAGRLVVQVGLEDGRTYILRP